MQNGAGDKDESKDNPTSTSDLGKKLDKSVVEIPKEYDDKTIPSDLSVRALLSRISFITQGDAKETSDWKGLFSREEPNTGLEDLFQLCVLPPAGILEKMLASYKEISANSVLDWSFKGLGKEIRYPLTVLVVYREYARANKTRLLWRKAEEWMARWAGQTNGLEVVAGLAGRLMNTLEWNTYIRASGTSVPTNELLSILDDEWLSDNQLDMILQVLTERLGNSTEHHDTFIAPCVFLQHVRNVYNARNKKKQLTVPLLERYKDKFTTGAKKTLFFVALVGNNHFVAWKIDYAAGTLCHGDSLGVSEKNLDEVKDCIQWWMSTISNEKRKWTYLGNGMEHGDQTKGGGDSFSCGIIACNAIAHEIFGDELWDIKNRRRLRVEAFNSIILHHNQRRPKRHTQKNDDSNGEEPEILDVRIIPLESRLDDGQQQNRTADNSSCSSSELEAHPEDDETNSEAVEFTDEYISGPSTSVSSSQPPSPTTLIQETDDKSYTKTVEEEQSSDDTNTRDQAQLSQDRHAQQPKRNHGHAEWEWSRVVHQGAQTSDGEMGINPEPNAMEKRAREPHDGEERPRKRPNAGTVGPLDLFLRPRSASAKNGGVDTKKGSDTPKDNIEDLEEAINHENEVHERSTKEVDAPTSVAYTSHEITGLGISRSARHAQKMRNARLSGTQVINKKLYDRKLRDPCLDLDPDALFDPDNWSVQHSKCCTWIVTKSLYQPGYFVEHALSCRADNKLIRYLTRAGTGSNALNASKRLPSKSPFNTVDRACAGLKPAHDARIEKYLRRATALGGGGKPVYELAMKHYGTPYSTLSIVKKKEIDRMHEAGWSWIINNRQQAIFSVSCEKTIKAPKSYSDIDVTCGPCRGLLRIKTFRNAISRPEPAPEKMKFVTKAYQQEELSKKFMRIKGVAELLDTKDQQTRTAVRYAIAVAKGEFSNHIVFTGLVETVLRRMDRLRSGKKMTNFKYPPAFDEFITTVHMVSPSAYRLLKDHFPVRSSRSIRNRVGKDSQFVAGISDQSFDRAAKFLKKLNVPGNHVALSADDTKLLATFRPFLDREKDEWYIVGGAGDPYLVSSPQDIRDELQKAGLEKATKVRIWVLMVPLPKVPPIVLAALAITEKVDAGVLFSYTMRIIDGLHSRGIWPVSYSCDGTSKERKNQRLLLKEAHSTDTRRIKSPSPIAPDLVIQIPMYHGKPIALIQDSLHARKTGRNNIQSGTKTMTVGDFPVLYQHLRDMGFAPNSPLYHRDVEKTDKQDDRAAARVFSADALEWLLKHGDDYFGTSILLFVVGELVDAFQNRNLSFYERSRMVLLAHYFIDIWKKFLRKAGYKRHLACLSAEALDISSILITGFFQAVFIYRDYFPGTPVPLLPWLHSSEACEHVFGECRKHVKDFDFASFLHMMPKIHAMLHYALQFGSPSTEDAKDRARGYIHTWMDTEGISLDNLEKFPSDEELNEIASQAFKDAEELWMQLEIFIQDLAPAPKAKRKRKGKAKDVQLVEKPDPFNVHGVLPSIAYFDYVPGATLQDSEDSSSESADEAEPEESDSDDGDYADDAEIDLELSGVDSTNEEQGESENGGLTILQAERVVLERLFEKEQIAESTGPFREKKIDDTMLNLSCAKLFLDFDTDIQIDEMYEPMQDEFDKWAEQYARDVGTMLADRLPPISEPPEPERPSRISTSAIDVRLSKETLLETRRSHQSKLEQKAVRTTNKATNSKQSGGPTTTDATNDQKKAERIARTLLIKSMNNILKEQQDVGKGTGLERLTRWTGNRPSGNAANAVAVAAEKATELLSKRSNIFSKLEIPRKACQLLSNAGVNKTYALQHGMYMIICTNKRLFVAQVMSLFTRGGGVYGNHSYTTSVDNVTLVSYASVQAFEHTSGPLFRAKTSATGGFQIRYFLHITSSEILFVLPDKPIERKNKTIIELSRVSFDVWTLIQSISDDLSNVITQLKGLK